jgi:carbamoyltransferase
MLVAAAEEERFSRKKHDSGFPNNAIEFCLRAANITKKNLDYVVFYEKPFTKFERILKTVLSASPHSGKFFRQAMVSWLSEKLWVKDIIKNNLGIEDKRILFSEHHISHAASAFFCSPFEEAAILTVDAVGEWTTATLGKGKDCDLTLFNELRFPHSVGLLYSTFTAFLGFEVNEGEYKVMGMAPYGTPQYVDEVYKLMEVKDDGSIWLDLDYFNYIRSPEKAFGERFEKIFGKPRDPKSNFFTLKSNYPKYFGAKPNDFETRAKENQYYADIAASIQKVTEEILLKMAHHLYQTTGLRKLCMAGGVALNSVANGRILNETPFEEIYIQPSAGDGGGAVGAALWGYHSVLGNPRQFEMTHAYWGDQFDEGLIHRFLTDANISYQKASHPEGLYDQVVDRLTQGEVIGWFQGKFEWGPRALGNRSIIADPRRADMKDIINTKIKFREPYRPFAPSVLVDQAEKFFEISNIQKQYPARFMLYVANVKEEKRKLVPAITHVDGTARPQTVSMETNPFYYNLIQRFEKATGIPMILNTSFNLRGEPIVNSPEDAFNTFSKSGMDALVLGPFIIEKK